jgi:hypothetical protein
MDCDVWPKGKAFIPFLSIGRVEIKIDAAFKN